MQAGQTRILFRKMPLVAAKMGDLRGMLKRRVLQGRPRGLAEDAQASSFWQIA
jgi:hypothetical protein